MGASQPSRMRACKFVKRDLTLRMTAKLASAGLADVDFTQRQAR
jgi:ribosomal protein L36